MSPSLSSSLAQDRRYARVTQACLRYGSTRASLGAPDTMPEADFARCPRARLNELVPSLPLRLHRASRPYHQYNTPFDRSSRRLNHLQSNGLERARTLSSTAQDGMETTRMRVQPSSSSFMRQRAKERDRTSDLRAPRAQRLLFLHARPLDTAHGRDSHPAVGCVTVLDGSGK